MGCNSETANDDHAATKAAWPLKAVTLKQQTMITQQCSKYQAFLKLAKVSSVIIISKTLDVDNGKRLFMLYYHHQYHPDYLFGILTTFYLCFQHTVLFSDIDLKKACKAFANKFSCGASVAGDDEIVIQGDVTYDLLDFIPEKWPEVSSPLL